MVLHNTSHETDFEHLHFYNNLCCNYSIGTQFIECKNRSFTSKSVLQLNYHL